MLVGVWLTWAAAKSACATPAQRATLPAMQTFRSAPVPLLLFLLAFVYQTSAASTPKVHTVTLGPGRRVPYTPPNSDRKSTEPESLKVRALFVDSRQREWTTGDLHDVTDRSFTVRRALRINDSLPGESGARWVWQPGPWLLVDRTTGHIAALHLPDFDPIVSEVSWFRDYAAYCGVATTAKGGLFAIVAQLGARKATVQKLLAHWPQPGTANPPCQPALWQRDPMRATLQLTGSDAVTYDVVGSTSLVEDGESEDQ
jgi:hypothetical protein